MSGRASLEKRRAHNRKWQEKALASGNCVICGKKRADDCARYCALCRAAQRRRCREYQRMQRILFKSGRLDQCCPSFLKHHTSSRRGNVR